MAGLWVHAFFGLLLIKVISCSTFCDFESECPWLNRIGSSNSRFWLKITGSTANAAFSLGPPTDHSTNTSQGSYILFSNSSNSAYFTSPLVDGYTCVEFWYYIYKSNQITLNLVPLARGSNRFQSIWSQKLFSQNQWVFAQAQIYLTPSYTLAFEAAINGPFYDGFVALDDIMIRQGPCSTVNYCSFENSNFCEFKNILNDYQWVIGNQIPGGLDHDHTTGNGDFLYIDFKNNPLSKAYLVSKQQNETSGTCLQFYYYASKSTMPGVLKVYMQHNLSLTPVFLWSSDNLEENEWKKCSIQIRSPGQKWNIMFEGIQGSYDSSLAVDDLRFILGSCPQSQDCSFDDGTLCDYKNEKQNSIDWLVKKGSDFFFTTDLSFSYYYMNSPPVDPFENVDSRYLFLDKLGSQVPGIGRLIGPVVDGMTSKTCIDFWFYIYLKNESDTSEISVWLADQAGAKVGLLWSTRHLAKAILQKNSKWLKGFFAYHSLTPHRLVLEGIKYQNETSLAVDNISAFKSSDCYSESNQEFLTTKYPEMEKARKLTSSGPIQPTSTSTSVESTSTSTATTAAMLSTSSPPITTTFATFLTASLGRISIPAVRSDDLTNQPESSIGKQSSNTLIIALTTIFPILFVILIAFCIYLYHKNVKLNRNLKYKVPDRLQTNIASSAL